MRCWCSYRSVARCRLFAYGPADATAIPKRRLLLPRLKSRLVLLLWCRLTKAVLEKMPLNGCSNSTFSRSSSTAYKWLGFSGWFNSRRNGPGSDRKLFFSGFGHKICGSRPRFWSCGSEGVCDFVSVGTATDGRSRRAPSTVWSRTTAAPLSRCSTSSMAIRDCTAVNCTISTDEPKRRPTSPSTVSVTS